MTEKHVCYDSQFIEDWIWCTCELGCDHADTDCDLSGHS